MKISHSRVMTFLECKKKYQHSYKKKVVPRGTPIYFTTGKAVHAFKEHFYSTRGKDIEGAIRQAMLEFDKLDPSIMNADEIHELEIQKSMVKGICSAYPEYYKGDFTQYKNFLIEKHFEIPLIPGVKYQGYVDVIAQDAAGDWWIIETKTASPQSINNDYFRRVYIDSQVTGYLHGVKPILGKFPRGVVYDVIKKPSIRLKKGESKTMFQSRVQQEYEKYAKEKEYFLREELIIGKPQRDEWIENMKVIAEDMQRYKGKDKVFPKNTGACMAKFGTCPYLDACITGRYDRLRYVKKDS